MDEGIVIRGHDVARVVGLMAGTDVEWEMEAAPMRRRLARRSLLLAAALSRAHDCRRRARTPTRSPTTSRRSRRPLGVKFKTPPKLEVRTRDQVRDFLLAKLRRAATPQKQIANQEATYKLLGLIPDTMHLARLLREACSPSRSSATTTRRRRCSTSSMARRRSSSGITIMHELVHALQDQYVEPRFARARHGDNDRAAAAQAVIEGAGEVRAARHHGRRRGQHRGATSRRLGLACARRFASTRKTQPIFASAPMVIQETLLFPYLNGADFVRRFKARASGQAAVRQPADFDRSN